MTILDVAIDSRPPRTAQPRAGGFRQGLRDILHFARRNIEHIRQVPEKLSEVTLQPVMFVLLFTYVFGNVVTGSGGSYAEFLMGGILVQTLAFGLLGPATAIATDMRDGMIDRFRTLPTTSAAYLNGHYVAQLACSVLAIAVSVVAGLAVGWRTTSGIVSVIGGFALLLLFATAMIWVGTWIGLSVRSPDAVMGMAMTVVFPITFISNAFVPTASLPAPLEWFANWNPVSVITSAVRELFGNPEASTGATSWPMENPVLAAFVACAALLGMAVVMAMRAYRRRVAS
jgi:ABC-2 type transport system permease protein